MSARPRKLTAALAPFAAVAVLAMLGAWAAASSRVVQTAAKDGAPPLATVAVVGGDAQEGSAFDGVVQAVRQTVVAAQVPGAVVALGVKAGDRVKAGQVLLRLDARAAEQAAAAGAAQVRAASAMQEAATRDFERQQQLFQQKYISQAALDRAEAQYKSAQAEAAAQLANAGAARTQSDFHTVRAPYDGIVADVSVVLGDMAMPGRALITLYDPEALRIAVPIPQTVAANLAGAALPQAEVPGIAGGRIQPVRSQLLPAVDPATHTMELRLDLPPNLGGLAPGMFARAWLAVSSGEGARLYVPSQAVQRRAELAGVYVVDAEGRALLRQVRLGRAQGGRVEVLAGLCAGERVALEPQAAARIGASR
ncbi:MAG TPA: efflux RND transporter periplasmic adaptor subunit [Ramlibacter sp.]|uniref:efflux RND transporter periplasmic adaptor subunit n=1 Tax=Ramlibacter sp. TaxID=1917967 RepID=UPI002C01470C|nr:efflux RND transporter periplasmic adaptor subunit [Ramlibacter sp.]HVZ45160.1 efflux RND transporter periplasmic adaptor subunit [Ramlibacter sp.]